MKVFAITFPLLAFASFARRDDMDGGGAPTTGGNNNNPLTNWVNKPGYNPSAPSKDNFYRKIPSDLARYTNGQIIEKRNISVSGNYAGIETAYQVKLKTEDAHSSGAVTWASVLIPRKDRLTGNVVLFQAPEDAANIDCAPTYQLFGRNTIPEVQSLISQGYVVVVPDYEGQRSSYTVGKLAGKHILDSARAALSLPDIKLANQTASIGLWGYGTGAYSTGWAAELAATYAPEVPLKGSAVGGFVTDLLDWMRNINSTPLAGNLVSSLLGMATEYKDIDDALQDNVIPRRRGQFDNAGSRCSAENVFHFFDTNVTAVYFTPGSDLLEDSKVKAVYTMNNLGQAAPKSSIFVYQGSNDREAAPSAVHKTLANYCRAGTVVQYRELNGLGHAQARSNYNDALDYFQSLFSGRTIDNTCSALLDSETPN